MFKRFYKSNCISHEIKNLSIIQQLVGTSICVKAIKDIFKILLQPKADIIYKAHYE